MLKCENSREGALLGVGGWPSKNKGLIQWKTEVVTCEEHSEWEVFVVETFGVMEGTGVELGRVAGCRDCNCGCRKPGTGRLSVLSKKKVPRKRSKKICGRHVYSLCAFWEWGQEEVTVKGKEIVVFSHIFIAASLILYELSQLGAYSFFIQSMCFLMSLNSVGCNIFFFYFSLLILFLGKHLLQCLLPTCIFLTSIFATSAKVNLNTSHLAPSFQHRVHSSG